MSHKEIASKIEYYLKSGDSTSIKAVLIDLHPSDIAKIIQSLDPEDHTFIVDSLDTETASDVYFELDSEQREEILTHLDEEKIADIAEEMQSDDAADLLGELPEEIAEVVLSKMDPEEVKEVEPLLKYPEDTAGGIMQAELVKVSEDSNVRDAIKWIRLIANDVEEFHTVYITTEHDKLLGQIPLSKLILANPDSNVKDVMIPVKANATPYMDQEEVADIFKRYDFVTLPVIDENGFLLGRITSDDILDVVTEEAEEDMYYLAGVKEHLHPIYTPTLERIRLRTPWLILTLLGELLIALIIIHNFKPTLEKVAILAAFMPAIMATGGNVGIQTTTIVVRSLGMGTINLKQFLNLILAEVKVGFALGVICGLVAVILGSLISINEPQIIKLALAVFIAMVSATIATSFIGVAGPLILQKFKFDPAASSGPFLTMFNDIFGSVFYLLIAMLIF